MKKPQAKKRRAFKRWSMHEDQTVAVIDFDLVKKTWGQITVATLGGSADSIAVARKFCKVLNAARVVLPKRGRP